MNSCCTPIYDTEFDLKLARRELKQYYRSGAKKSSQPMITKLRSLDLQNKTLLDIGGGVGSIIFELLKEGLQKTTYVDISYGYSQTFREEVEQQKIKNQIEIFQGDFLDLHTEISPAHLVTMDKVICCYEDYQELVKYSLNKSQRWYAFIIPRDTWWVKAVHGLELMGRKLIRNSFRTWIHPVNEIREMIVNQGFQEIFKVHRREWLVLIYERSEAN